MKLGEIQVVGVAKREKDNNISYVLHGVTPFEDWENGIGLKTVQEWTRADLSGLNKNDVIVPVYTRGYQGKAQFCGYNLVNNK